MKHIFKGMANDSIDTINNNFDELSDPKRDVTVNDLTVNGQIKTSGGLEVSGGLVNHGSANFQNGLAVTAGDAVFYGAGYSKKVADVTVWDNGLNAHIYRVGNIVVVQIFGSILTDHGAFTTIGWKIPAGYRPAYESHGIASAGYTKTIMRFHTSGDVNIIDSPLKASDNNGGDNYSYGFAVWATADDFPS
ncbi:hypothetical protein [Fructobacillus tropaeoli]|uniref:Galactarate dehydratase n=1 Tax=Fructobacillus tropaeoli TaxID=709323 RepID=A0A3F3H1U0_9LACO|nr:hypothetical protein [Fructobacillus tropaeoli]GAP04935.1 galactarate dehydratase [Fructobacillus tropaeoli]